MHCTLHRTFAAYVSRHTLTPLFSSHLHSATAVSLFIRLLCIGDKISWLGGQASQWHPPRVLPEHKHCDNAASTVIRTARTLEAEWRQVCGEAWVRGKKEDESSTGRVWAAVFHRVTARSRSARVLKIMNRLYL